MVEEQAKQAVKDALDLTGSSELLETKEQPQPRNAEEAAAALDNMPPDTPSGTVVEYEGERCSNCNHQLQLQCQLLPSGRNSVKADGHCSRWSKL